MENAGTIIFAVSLALIAAVVFLFIFRGYLGGKVEGTAAAAALKRSALIAAGLFIGSAALFTASSGDTRILSALGGAVALLYPAVVAFKVRQSLEPRQAPVRRDSKAALIAGLIVVLLFAGVIAFNIYKGR